MVEKVADIAVTGSTGALGGRVAQILSDAGLQQRLPVRDISRAPQLPGAATVRATYSDRDSAETALSGVKVLFMVSASETADRVTQHRTFVDAAKDAGVEHLVYTSFLGAATDATFTLGRDHWATEEHIRGSGLGFTFLRNNFYQDIMPMLAGDDGVIRGPGDHGRVSAVTREDIAAAAAVVLQDPGPHAGRTYNLTGPEALTFAEIAATISDVTGRDLSYYNETVEEAYESRKKWDAPGWQYDAWVSTYTAVAKGELDGVSGDVEALTGRTPLTFRQFLEGGKA
ncbi:SDR family oxidoreductase [Arthrobacter sp. H14]|uniref:SDR family oxidoreductase n=1 Tax=Arthrobacter sp. H14 TaxID=1312959 RepID=UPI00047E0FFB|nr:SDR family oxidoreductase [Arthrobacter sp. H14]